MTKYERPIKQENQVSGDCQARRGHEEPLRKVNEDPEHYRKMFSGPAKAMAMAAAERERVAKCNAE